MKVFGKFNEIEVVHFDSTEIEDLFLGKPVEKEHFTFGEKATISIDEILAIKNGESVGFTVKGLPFRRNNLKLHFEYFRFCSR